MDGRSQDRRVADGARNTSDGSRGPCVGRASMLSVNTRSEKFRARGGKVVGDLDTGADRDGRYTWASGRTQKRGRVAPPGFWLGAHKSTDAKQATSGGTRGPGRPRPSRKKVPARTPGGWAAQGTAVRRGMTYAARDALRPGAVSRDALAARATARRVCRSVGPRIGGDAGGGPGVGDLPFTDPLHRQERLL